MQKVCVSPFLKKGNDSCALFNGCRFYTQGKRINLFANKRNEINENYFKKINIIRVKILLFIVYFVIIYIITV